MRISESRDLIMAERERSLRFVQVTLAVLALASLAVGLGIFALANRIGVPEDTARVLASAFLVAAIVDAIVLYLWERIFPDRK